MPLNHQTPGQSVGPSTASGELENMTLLRRILAVAALTAAATGVASADLIQSFQTFFPASGSSLTDFQYTLTLPQFNQSGMQLNSVTIYFQAHEDVSGLTVTNVASSEEDSFSVRFSSDIADTTSPHSFVNTANAADVGDIPDTTLNVFNSGIITLGGSGSQACGSNGPSGSCSSETYAPPDITRNNVVEGTGVLGVAGQVIHGANVAAYTGTGDFSLIGFTQALTTFTGGGGNILLNQSTNAQFSAEVDYSYSIPGTPEPATMALMGGALLGLGLLRKRIRKQQAGY